MRPDLSQKAGGARLPSMEGIIGTGCLDMNPYKQLPPRSRPVGQPVFHKTAHGFSTTSPLALFATLVHGFHLVAEVYPNPV